MERRGTGAAGRWFGILCGAAALSAVGFLLFGGFGNFVTRGVVENASRKGQASDPAEASADAVIRALRQGDSSALRTLRAEILPAKPDDKPRAIQPEEIARRIDEVRALRVGFSRLEAPSRVEVVGILGRLFDRFTVDPTPTGWDGLLPPAHDLFVTALGDPSPAVRVAALNEVARLWNWTPGCTLLPDQDTHLATWKDAFHEGVVRRLADSEPITRVAAVQCLGALPLDRAAAPGAAFLNDANPAVRVATLQAFASRRDLVGEDAVLPLLHDTVKEVAMYAEGVLRVRGLNADQIGLGRMVSHPRREMRIAAIPMLLKRTDIDPEVWLIHLTNDKDDAVRLEAVKACEGRVTPEIRQRLREMAAADDSDDVRTLARRLAPADTTASLPPLPGSASLNPKAN